MMEHAQKFKHEWRAERLAPRLQLLGLKLKTAPLDFRRPVGGYEVSDPTGQMSTWPGPKGTFKASLAIVEVWWHEIERAIVHPLILGEVVSRNDEWSG